MAFVYTCIISENNNKKHARKLGLGHSKVYNGKMKIQGHNLDQAMFLLSVSIGRYIFVTYIYTRRHVLTEYICSVTPASFSGCYVCVCL